MSPFQVSRRAFLAGAAALAAGAPERAPVLFVSHGSPLFADKSDARIEELKAWGRILSKPKGIVVMTPHYAFQHIEIGATGRGFAMYNLPRPMKRRLPQDLDYPSPPSAALASRVEGLLSAKHTVTRAKDRRGFDHTVWMPLLCLFPDASAPVVELSYPYLGDAGLFQLGRMLSSLRDEGVVFVASGGVTHNLASMDRDPARGIPRWSAEFDAWAAERMAAQDVDALVDWRHKGPATDLAHPDDGGHFRVSIVALGVALGPGGSAKVTFPVTGFEGTLSKRGVELR